MSKEHKENGKTGKADDLINRYIYAVGRLLPLKNRKEIEEEIRSLISDMLEQRLSEAGKTFIEKDIQDVRLVLTELGLPSSLAGKYRNDRDSYLIGPAYYPQYILLLKIVMAALTFGLTLAAVLGAVFSENIAQDMGSVPQYIPLWLTFLANLFFSIVNGAFWAFGMITLMFVIFQKKGINFSMSEESLDALPEVPQKKETYGKVESIVSIVSSVIFFVLFLTASGIFRVFDDKGLNFPVFLSEVIQSRWLFLTVILLCSVMRDVIRLYAYKRTLKTFAAGFICNSIAVPFTILLLSDGKIFNPEFYSFMSSLFAEDLPSLSVFFSSISLFLMGLVLFALLLDIVDDFVRAEK